MRLTSRDGHGAAPRALHAVASHRTGRSTLEGLSQPQEQEKAGHTRQQQDERFLKRHSAPPGSRPMDLTNGPNRTMP